MTAKCFEPIDFVQRPPDVIGFRDQLFERCVRPVAFDCFRPARRATAFQQLSTRFFGSEFIQPCEIVHHCYWATVANVP